MRKPGSECVFEGCLQEVHAKGLCPGHHAMQYRTGKLEPLRPKTTPEERFWENVRKTDYCWEWTGRKERGAGRMWDGSRLVLSHVFSYEIHLGKISGELEIDHKCRNRGCVNPTHLRAVERWVNAQNKGVRAENTSGYKGVTLVRKTGKYLARTNLASGKRIHLGHFETPKEAAKALLEFNMERGLYTLYEQGLSREFGVDYPPIEDWR